MPEGDTIAWHAHRLRAALEGRTADEIRVHARFSRDSWPERLAGRAVERIDTLGKHLLLVFTGELVLHSHLGMVGTWGVYRPGRRWGRSPRRAWLILRVGEAEVVQFDGSTLELLTAARARAQLRSLGPDILASTFEVEECLRRLRLDDPARPIGDSLLDQRILAGIGNMWKAEGCWEAEVDPWRPMAEVSDEEVTRIIQLVRPRMIESGVRGPRSIDKKIYGRASRPCLRCGTAIQQRGQWEDNRLTLWCPGCQH